MFRIAFVIPYIGKLPDYFSIWLETVRQNPTIDFLLFIDDGIQYDWPKNVIVHYTNMENLKAMFQSKFEFNISLETPYKLCDYKPTYGDVFEEYLKEYDFWGHCDIDLIWGNIRHFLTDEVLSKYDRIYKRGHCTLYRNKLEVNTWYKTMPNRNYLKWDEVYKSPKSFCFDEIAGHCGGGISMILDANGVESYDSLDMADLNIAKSGFEILRDAKMKSKLFLYSQGCLYAIGNIKKEYLYVHFQKRKIEFEKNLDFNRDIYFYAPGYFTNGKPPLFRLIVSRIKYIINYFSYRAKRYLKQ